MASNELAAILARRRKAGGENESPMPAVEMSAPPAPEMVPAAARGSIAERIARLKQQSAAASAAGVSAPAPVAPRFNHPQPVTSPRQAPEQPQSVGPSVTEVNVASEPVDTSAVAAAQEAAGIRKASNKIQQLQGSLGINVNPFGRPGGPSNGGYRNPATAQRESIMRTGEEQYGHSQHAMGVAMPGLTGSAIPMPGLAKGGFRLPGMAPEGAPDAQAPAPLDDSHATMTRVAGPKRRGPARPPPGAFRIPTMAAPIIDNVEPIPAPAAATASEPSAALFPSSEPVPAAVHEPIEVKPLEAPAVISPPAAATIFPSSPAVVPPIFTPAPITTPQEFYAPAPAPAVKATPTPAVQKLPEPELMPAMKPYQIEDDDPYAPKYEKVDSYDAPAGFPSALMANFSMDELALDDMPKTAPKPAPASEAASLFGGFSAPASNPVSPPPAVPAPVPGPTPVREVAAKPTPAPERSLSPTPVYTTPAPAPVQEPTPTPVFEPVAAAPTPAAAPVIASTPAPMSVAPTPTPAPEPTPSPAPVAAAPAPAVAPSATSLFGAAAAADDDEDSSDSDWSDDDNGGSGQPTLFGAPAPKSAVAAAAPAPVLVAPTQATPELHQAPTPVSGSLFGDASSSAAPVAQTTPAPAPGFVKAAPQATIPPTSYGSLFGGGVSSSDSESDSDSDDGGGLFGTGLPSKR